MKRLLIGALLLLVPRAAIGATFVVNTTLDYVDAVPGDGVCAAANGTCTLRAAVQEANALPGAHVIALPAGIYTLSIDRLEIAPGATITINGANQATTIVDGNGQHGVFAVSGGNLTLNELTIRHGFASDGAGIFVSGVGFPTQYSATLTVNATTITQNVSTANGGGVSVHGPASARMSRGTISGNSAASLGGGIYVFQGADCTYSVEFAATYSTITQNVATDSGGGLYVGGSCFEAASGSISQSTISSNSAGQGGGIYFAPAATGGFSDTTISGNTATTGSGGAMLSNSILNSFTWLVNVTAVFNSSATGGAVAGAVQVKNSIIANSTGSASSNCVFGPSDLGNNLEFPGSSCPFGLASDRHADPRLLPLALNGGVTQTYALAIDSPAIDAADDSWCRTVDVDQRGVPRIVGAHCDIGAYEFAPPTVVTGDATNLTLFSGSLATAIFNGTVNPNGTATTGFFQYGQTTAYGGVADIEGRVQGLGAGSSPIALVGSPLPMACGALYHFRAIATNADGTTTGADATFTTLACLPATVTTGVAGPIHATSANIQGTLSTNNAATTVTVEYGLTTSYGGTSLPLSVPGGYYEVPVARLLTGLQCNTLYHYRVKATNVSVSVAGVDGTFISAACGSSTAPLFWRNQVNGKNVAWLMNGAAMQTWASLPTVADPRWTIEATGDIDGDGQEDIVWRNSTTGQMTAWFLNGVSLVRWIYLPTMTDTRWTIKGLQDFDGDGNADLLWHNSLSGQTVIWFLNGTGMVNWAYAPTMADVNWEIAGVADFDGDRNADVFWRNKATGDLTVWYMNGATRRYSLNIGRVSDPGWVVAAVGDLDGDTHADIVWRNSTSGKNVAWFISGDGVTRWSYLMTVSDPNWGIARVADLDGDGASDLVWRNRVSGANVLWQMNGEQLISVTFIPAVSDLNWSLIGR